MTTRMIHPEHGAMHAYDTGEIERLERLGWAVERPAAEPVAKNSFTATGVGPVVGLPQNAFSAVIERKKPGPKPKAK